MKTIENQDIDFNQYFQEAYRLMEETDSNLFVTGQAGTGKSTLLSYFVNHTNKRLAVVAPTGVAALNVHGETIHSLFGFKPSITIEAIHRASFKPKRKKLFEQLEVLVIDEISMVRADLLDCIDVFLRRFGPNPLLPMGGIQLICFGDLYQLPPVVTSEEKRIFTDLYDSPYFFSAGCMDQLNLKMIELETIYRQHDQEFIRLLNAVRNRTLTDEDITNLNQRVVNNFSYPEDEVYVTLTMTNAQAIAINEQKLNELADIPHEFFGEITGNFDQKSVPAPEALKLKIGAQVMCTANHPNKFYVNGTMGIVDSIKTVDGEPEVAIITNEGIRLKVQPFTWDMSRFIYDEKQQQIKAEPIGSYTQLPIMLAWAVTIHKSQGKTFDRVIVDLSRSSFAHGQTYVALSRCTSFEGMVFTKPIKKSHVLMDTRVVKFLVDHQYHQARESVSLQAIETILRQAIDAHSTISITYLKSSNVKSRRLFTPCEIGDYVYAGKTFHGVRGFDQLRDTERVFRIDRILEISVSSS